MTDGKAHLMSTQSTVSFCTPNIKGEEGGSLDVTMRIPMAFIIKMVLFCNNFKLMGCHLETSLIIQ